MRHLFCIALSLYLVAHLSVVTVKAAQAQVDWCSGDPPVHVILPSGMPLEVTVRVSVPRAHRAALRSVTASGEVVDLQGNTARLLVTVVVPSDGPDSFPVKVAATSHGNTNEATATSNQEGEDTVIIPLTVTLPPGLS